MKALLQRIGSEIHRRTARYATPVEQHVQPHIGCDRCEIAARYYLACQGPSVCVCTTLLRVRDTQAGERGSWDNGAYAATAGDSSGATNRIDSVIAPADQLSPGSVGVSRASKGIVR